MNVVPKSEPMSASSSGGFPSTELLSRIDSVDGQLSIDRLISLTEHLARSPDTTKAQVEAAELAMKMVVCQALLREP